MNTFLFVSQPNPNVPIRSTKVDVGVKGGPNHPAFAAVPWTTPAQAGVYCIQVKLEPPDDLNCLEGLATPKSRYEKCTGMRTTGAVKELFQIRASGLIASSNRLPATFRFLLIGPSRLFRIHRYSP